MKTGIELIAEERLRQIEVEGWTADNMIRILDLCGARSIDIEKHIEMKMKYNQTRERMHGKKY